MKITAFTLYFALDDEPFSVIDNENKNMLYIQLYKSTFTKQNKTHSCIPTCSQVTNVAS